MKKVRIFNSIAAPIPTGVTTFILRIKNPLCRTEFCAWGLMLTMFELQRQRRLKNTRYRRMELARVAQNVTRLRRMRSLR